MGEVYSFAINLTKRSVSGFGVLIFHKDEFSWILISISILLFILVLFDELVATIKRNRILLYAISLVSLLIFILYSLYFVEVDLEWGIGITVALTLAGLLLAIKDKRQSASE